MQIATADAQFFGGFQLVARMHAQRRAHQFAFEAAQRMVERSRLNFLWNLESLELRGQILHRQMHVAIGQHQAALDHVLQLADIARPIVPGE